jgi:hypothetical protein
MSFVREIAFRAVVYTVFYATAVVAAYALCMFF